MEYLYYGRYGENYKFDDKYINKLISLSPTGKVTSTTNAFKLDVSSKINESSDTYLTRTFLTYIEIIPDIMLREMGFSLLNIHLKRVSPPSQIVSISREDVRKQRYPQGLGTKTSSGGKQRKTIKKNKTRTNSKTRKMRKIRKHKFTKRMKKSNRHKRSRK